MRVVEKASLTLNLALVRKLVSKKLGVPEVDLTDGHLAAELGGSHSDWHRYRLHGSMPSVGRLVDLSVALRVPMSSLIVGPQGPCDRCNGKPPVGFTCNACGVTR